ncbi:mannonate dehydratase [Actinotalea sp. BY-33]|uniref:Mannonate dehydratase n=1 Tax=Actinotalea soli TaxID=2819234 RepID=A0A939LQI1_9CELL|nr:mannonate dehydratase [Actinotalea soli]MBO1752631.1 mannonate dehydratase [Actinotalea soli]
MERTWRWFGPQDPITLAEVRQTGTTGVVTALHHVPNGEVWPVEEIRRRQAEVEAAGLTWSVVESVPVHEDVRRGAPGRDRWIEAYGQTLENLARCGIDLVCYNVMPALDWTRTHLDHVLPNGATALRFDADAAAAFDLTILLRPGAEADYTPERVESAHRYAAGLSDGQRETLTQTILAGLPGAEEGYTLEAFRTALAAYEGIGREELRANLRYFLEGVVPVAEQVGVRLALHPDDPPRPVFGLPRVVSTLEDAQWVLDAVPSEANGLTLCVGSYGVRADNDVVEMARVLARRVYFTHLRSTRREADPESFHEADHIDGDNDMVGVVRELVAEEMRREREGGPRIVTRPDHGHQLLDDHRRATNPGYPLIGRLKGLAEVRGVELAVRRWLEEESARGEGR